MNRAIPILTLSALVAAAAGSQAAEYATVVSSTPVVVSLPATRRVCTDEQQMVQPAPSGAGTVIGAIAGGVLGNQFGGAGAAVGALAGSLIGTQAELNATPPVTVPVRNCRNVTQQEQRTVGYDVMYDYAGQRYSTRVARDPGARMAIDVRPAAATTEYAPVPAPAAAAGADAQADGTGRVVYEPVPAIAENPQVVYAAPYPAYYPGYYPGYYYGAPYYAPVIGLGFGYYGGYGYGRYGGYYGGYRGHYHGR